MFSTQDFKNPLDAFFWLGYYCDKQRSFRIVENIKRRDDDKGIIMNVADENIKHVPLRVPLSETADFCVLDTETSGLSTYDCAVQVAVGLFRKDGTPLGFYNKLWKLPPNVTLSASAVKVHHITTSMLLRDGLDAKMELDEVNNILKNMIRRKKRIIAHNASFDMRILRQTAHQHKYTRWFLSSKDVFCTMQNSKALCKAISPKTGKIKSPSNSELYKKLSGNNPIGPLHDAVFDVKITAKSFVLGVERGWWSCSET